MTEAVDPADVAEHLRRVLAEIDAGRVQCGPVARAHLAGALDAAEWFGRFYGPQ